MNKNIPSCYDCILLSKFVQSLVKLNVFWFVIKVQISFKVLRLTKQHFALRSTEKAAAILKTFLTSEATEVVLHHKLA